MNSTSVFCIGHITNDLEPVQHLGGGVSYSAVVAAKLGFSSHIITESPPHHPYLTELKNLGVRVHRLPTVVPRLEKKITSFRNFYDKKGHRRQIVTARQDDINMADLPNFPKITEDSTILVAPVISEVNTELFPILANYGNLVVTPQGYFREIGPAGIVRRKLWSDIQSLSNAAMTILSDEDLTFEGEIDIGMLNAIRSYCPIVVLTQGTEGSTVFERDTGTVFRTKVFPLNKDEVKDLTGAGDTYAAAFVTQYEHTKDLRGSAAFASLYSALKIKGLGGEGIGISTIPTLEQVEGFIQSSKERHQAFLRENGLKELHFYREGNHHSKESI